MGTNIGIATGEKSKVLVLDIDPRNGGAESLAKLQVELGELPETVTSDTGGGGQHLVFRYGPEPLRPDHRRAWADQQAQFEQQRFATEFFANAHSEGRKIGGRG